MTDRKFTEDELVELLRVCVKRTCWKCYVKDLGECCNYCIWLPISKSADLIERQKAEIERLIEQNARLNKECDHYIDFASTAKAEAIKEFAERLRKKITDYYGNQDQEEDEGSAVCDCLSYLGCDIDDLVKEMTEEEKHD